MSFPINTGIPAANNDPADDQPLMQQNFANISGFLSVDHVTPGTSNTAGYHQQVHLLNESAPGIGNANGVLYANLATGKSWPFWQNGPNSYQIMGQNSINTSGYVTIPGGLILQWGSIAATNTNPSVSFPLMFPTALFNIQVTRQHSPTSPGSNSMWVSTTGLSTSGFTIINDDGHTWAYNWFAIGN